MSVNKTFPCDLCEKTFSRNGDLTRHKAIHSGEKNHICDVCGMRFAQYSGLKTHQNTHTGEKPHKCGYCYKAFGDPSSCTRHEKEKHEAKPFQCCWCPSSIVRRSSFASHVRTKHPQFRHLVTKEYLDAIEGPRRLKARGKNGRKIRSAALSPLSSASRPLSKVVVSEPAPKICARRTPAVDKGALAPTGVVRKVVEATAVDSRAELEHSRPVVPDTFWPLTFDIRDFITPYTDREPVAQQPVSRYSQRVYQHRHQRHQQSLKMLDCGLGLSMQHEGSLNGRDTRSLTSSPMPDTPQEVKPLPGYFVEPSKINAYDFAMLFGSTDEQQYVAPPLYSYSLDEQQGLLYL